MIGNNIAIIRKLKHMTQQELADAIKVKRTTLSKIENYNMLPSAETMKAISDSLQVPLGDIFFNPDVLKNNTETTA